MANLGKLSVTLAANFKQFEQAFNKAQGDVKNFEMSVGKTAAALQNFAGPLASAFSVGAVVAGINASIDAFAEFEATLTRVGGVSRTLGTDSFDELAASARNLAASTEFTASEVGEAMKFLAMSGQSANTVLESTPKVLQLASAAMMDVAQAADIATNVMTGFGMTATELGKANDVLFTTTTNSNTSMQQLGEAFKFAGPVAKSAGLTFEDTAATLGVLANAAFQSEMGGTALRGMMTKLLAPSGKASKIIKRLGIDVVTATGQLKPMREVIDQLAKSGATTGELMQVFGQRAGPGVAALITQGVEAFDKLADSIDKGAGSAAKMAEANLKTLQGQLKILGSAFEELKITVGEGFAPILKDTLIPILRETINLFAYLGKVISFTDGETSTAADRLAEAVAERARMINTFQVRIQELQASMRNGGTIDTADATRRIENLTNAIERLRKKQIQARSELSGAAPAAKNVASATNGISDAADKAAARFKKMRDSIERALKAFEEKTINIELKAGAEGPAQTAARKLVREFEKLTAAREKINQIELAGVRRQRAALTAELAKIKKRAGEGADNAAEAVLRRLRRLPSQAQRSTDKLNAALEKLGNNAESQALALLETSKTYRDWDRAMREMRDAGILTADTFDRLRAEVDPAKFKTGQAKRRDTDAGEAFAALSKESFAALMAEGLAAFDRAQKEAADKAKQKAQKELQTQIDLEKAEKERIDNMRIAQLESMQRNSVVWQQLAGSMIGGLESFVMGAFDRIASHVVAAFDNAIDSVAQILTANQRVSGLANAFAPITGILSTLGGLLAAFAAGAAVAVAATGVLGVAAQALVVVFAAGVTSAVALIAAIATLSGVLLGFATALVAGLLAPLIPIATAMGAIAFAVTNAIAALALLPVTAASLVSAFAFLVMETKSFGEFTDAMGEALQPLVDAAEPFASNLMFLTGVVAILAEAFVPLVAAVANSEALMRVFLLATQLAASALLDFVGVSLGIIDFFMMLGSAMLTLFRVLAEFTAGVIELIPGGDVYTEDIRRVSNAARDASNALEDIRPSQEQRESLAEARAQIWAATLGDLTSAGRGLVPPVEDAATQFQELSSQTQGVVEGFNFERLRFEAAGGGLGDFAGADAGGGFAGDAPGSVIINGPITVVANTPDEMLQELEQAQRRQQFIMTGSITPAAKGAAARTVG